jgi:short-subunit dehydrogenase
MTLDGANILLTGAAGGIGAALARQLAARGARLLLAGRDLAALESLAGALSEAGAVAHAVCADLLDDGAPAALAVQAMTRLGGVDVLINNAGISSFRLFEDETPEGLERLLHVNLLAPMQLTRALLPAMLSRGSGRIVNVGSTFGSIAFACFAGYSASKFGLRGFSEALRRELADSGVGVTYVAPRAVRTPLNPPAVERMAAAVHMAMDEPAAVAAHIVRAIERDAGDVYLGWPEALFVRLNAVLPRLVDGALRAQNAVMASFARQV